MKKRVLLVDLDPQGNASTGLGLDGRAMELTALEVLLGECPVEDAIVTVDKVGIDLLPSNADLTAAEVALMQGGDRERALKIALTGVATRYHYMLIDCPPSLNMLTLNALTAANSVLIPMQCEYYALEGLTSLMATIEQVQDSVNPGLRIEGLLRTMFDVRNNLSGEVSRQLTEHFGNRVYRTLVPRNVRVAEAPSYGLPVVKYDRSSRGAIAYLGLAGEFLRREQQRAEAHPGEYEGGDELAAPRGDDSE